jgi:hypothetical protein
MIGVTRVGFLVDAALTAAAVSIDGAAFETIAGAASEMGAEITEMTALTVGVTAMTVQIVAAIEMIEMAAQEFAVTAMGLAVIITARRAEMVTGLATVIMAAIVNISVTVIFAAMGVMTPEADAVPT